ncbi:hypothetical protein GCM10022221_31860 [Actinocorallia aurea]
MAQAVSDLVADEGDAQVDGPFGAFGDTDEAVSPAADVVEGRVDGFGELGRGVGQAAVDGMRFVVPVPAVFARPNRKYFGSKRGMTWLNAMNDQGVGRGAKVVSGTVRDSLHMVDVLFGLDGGELPEIVVSPRSPI